MDTTRRLATTVLTASLAAFLLTAQAAAQGKGKGGGGGEGKGKGHEHSAVDRGGSASRGQGQGKGKGSQPGQGRAKDNRSSAPAVAGRGNPRDVNETPSRAETRADQKIERRLEREFAGDVVPRGLAKKRFQRDVTVADLKPSLRRTFVSDRIPVLIATGAVARAHLRGVGDDVIRLEPVADRVRILNRDGVVLVDLDDDEARRLGAWDVIPMNDDVDAGAPSFCRSGAGHPVFGRQWCLEKGFGLGYDNDYRWGRTRLDDVVFRAPVSTVSLARDGLISLLGPVAYDRIALHALTLGLTDALIGRWMGEPTGSRVMLVSSGTRPVAEFVDVDRDDRPELLLVALRDW